MSTPTEATPGPTATEADVSQMPAATPESGAAAEQDNAMEQGLMAAFGALDKPDGDPLGPDLQIAEAAPPPATGTDDTPADPDANG